MDEAKVAWDGKKSEAEKALLAAKKPLDDVKILRDAVSAANGKLKIAKAAEAAGAAEVKKM